jgi:hypothetical protein
MDTHITAYHSYSYPSAIVGFEFEGLFQRLPTSRISLFTSGIEIRRQ